ncbi:diguanylate cyclase (GGDEF) domain protein [Roseibium alexandrii DFL-11]|uniref:Diguanylate cyclase (GGDEF) domain protein n=1 Tax=Roseibium alexandrii (strain DSM 17067 / NCIMB 14079 / DFL-11) TaxID=244592 RepID=A0A5E8GZ85_ROSAD|nr:diguanylate cyclase (GGDEF) domain protein [Roseibium alexandrii DFL-11]
MLLKAKSGLELLKKSFLDLTADAVAVCRLGLDGRALQVAYTNQAFDVLFGARRDWTSGNTFPFASVHRQILHDPSGKIRKTVKLSKEDGSTILVSASGFAFQDEAAGELYSCVTYMDISSETFLAEGDERHPEAGSPDQEVAALKHAHERILGALNAYPDPIVIYDSELNLVFRNDSYAASMSDTPGDLVEGMHLREVLRLAIKHGRYPVAIGREDEWIDEILSPATMQMPAQDVELDGDVHHRLMRSRAPNGDYVVIRLNSTEFVREKRAAEEAQARLLAALNAYPAPFVIYDAGDCLVVCNDAYRASMSTNPAELKFGMHRTEIARIAIRAGKISNAIGREEEWMSDRHQDREMDKPVQDLELPGDVHHRLLRSRVENGDLVILRIDTTELVRHRRALERNSEELKKANAEITHMALHDDLTGLGNRRYLAKTLEEFTERRQATGGEIAALHIDLDRFKQINDTMGHRAGDDVLVEAANRIRLVLEPAEAVARIGGDEFVVLVPLSDSSDRPADLANTLLKDLSRPVRTHDKECRVGASIGIAETPLSEVENLLTNSDVALYKAKHRGRGRIEVYDCSDLEDVRRAKALADDILRAIEKREFEPYYQPQVEAKSGQIVGIEVLARWRHPEKGILAPSEFLTVATDISVAGEIDQQMFEKAIEQCRNLPVAASGSIALSFNVSEDRVNLTDLEDIQRQIQAYPGQISFELLETIFLEEQDNAFLQRLNELRGMGISIEVDDFGSGRASVVALQRINPDRLKIDRRLAPLVTAGSGGLRLLRSIIEIAQALELGVTAEGVETKEQADLLSKLGCDRLQGYYFAKPMPFSDLVALLEAQQDDPHIMTGLPVAR